MVVYMEATQLPTIGQQARKAVTMTTTISFEDACDHVAANFEATNGFVSAGTYMVELSDGLIKEITFQMGESGIVRPVA